MERLKVSDVMTRGVVAIHEKASVRDAIEIMADYDISGLVVTTSMDRVIGVVAEIDIVKVLDKCFDEVTVKEIMTAPAVTIGKQESLKTACQMMQEKNIHRIVVLSEETGVSENGDNPVAFPCGIISISDVIEVIAASRQKIIIEG
ncbi:CBS domain-containing protein [bacterium]|nr:CBS domain-containing protein [bacterium]MBU1753290.1 CBS domain-containing protein [bacterium]